MITPSLLKIALLAVLLILSVRADSGVDGEDTSSTTEGDVVVEDEGQIYTIAMKYELAANRTRCGALAGYKLHTITISALEYAGAHLEATDDQWTSIHTWIDELKNADKKYKRMWRFDEFVKELKQDQQKDYSDESDESEDEDDEDHERALLEKALALEEELEEDVDDSNDDDELDDDDDEFMTEGDLPEWMMPDHEQGERRLCGGTCYQLCQSTGQQYWCDCCHCCRRRRRRRRRYLEQSSVGTPSGGLRRNLNQVRIFDHQNIDEIRKKACARAKKLLEEWHHDRRERFDTRQAKREKKGKDPNGRVFTHNPKCLLYPFNVELEVDMDGVIL